MWHKLKIWRNKFKWWWMKYEIDILIWLILITLGFLMMHYGKEV